MRFKREDIGLYVATALIGGGFGLLAGAFLTARINRKREEDFRASDAARDETLEKWYPEDEPMDDRATFEVVNINSTPLIIEPVKEESKKIVMASAKDVVEEEGRVVPGRQAESHRLSKEDRITLNRLMLEYGLTGLQIELVEKGTLDVYELENILAEEAANEPDLDISVEEVREEPLDYGRQYRADEKPDMADLLEKPIDDLGPRDVNDLLVTVGDKWEILLAPPKGKSEHQKRTVYFDPEDESIYTKTKTGTHAPADLRVIASEEVRDIIMPWLLFEKELEVIYIDDTRNKKTRWYEIVRLKEDDDDVDQ